MENHENHDFEPEQELLDGFLDPDEEEDEEEGIDLFRAEDGAARYRALEGMQDRSPFVGTVTIDLDSLANTAVLDFIREIFTGKNISYGTAGGYWKMFFAGTVRVTVKDYDLIGRADISDLLDRCVLLNTYLKYYFKKIGAVGGHRIFYGVHHEENKLSGLCTENGPDGMNASRCPLTINGLVRSNTDVAGKIPEDAARGWDKLRYPVYEYDYIFTKLATSLASLAAPPASSK